jgi:CHAD domain-containing protein
MIAGRSRPRLSHTDAARSVRRLLKTASGQLASVNPKASGWSALGPGLKRSYRDGRHGYRLAQQSGTPEHFHEWRKRVKDLYYQVGLLCPVWPEQMAASEAELKELGERLGYDHDVYLLTEPGIIRRFRQQALEQAETLQALARQRQEELHVQALALGARFYQEKPSAFCKRLELYWKRWRCEPKNVLKSSF